MSIKAFSLIELMVVIGIVAILSAVALPSYKEYTIRTQVIKGMNILNQQVNTLRQEYYKSGSFPDPFTYNGTSVPGNTWTNISEPSGTIINFGYTPRTNGMVLQAGLNGMTGIPGYGVTAGNNIGVAIYNDGLIFKAVCGVMGSWAAPDPYNVPKKYLPANCTCNEIATFATNGTGC